MMRLVVLVVVALVWAVQLRSQEPDTVDAEALENARVVVEGMQLQEIFARVFERELVGTKRNKNGVPDSVRVAMVAAMRDGSLATVMIRHVAVALRADHLEQLARACSDSAFLAAVRKAVESGAGLSSEVKLTGDESARMALALGIAPAVQGLSAVMQSRAFLENVKVWMLEMTRRFIEHRGNETTP